MELELSPLPTDYSNWLEIDIRLVASRDTPVLVSAEPEDALVIARLIAAAGREGRPPDILTCDPAKGEDVTAALGDPRLGYTIGRAAPILLLREVHALTPSDQSILMKHLSERRCGPLGHSARIIVSSSIDLFECTRNRTFDERLFYRLNGIHIVPRPPGLQHPA
jgi:hypothetical protein